MSGPGARGPLLVLAAATLWGTAGAAQELGPPEAWPPAVAALRSLLGGALLSGAVLLWRGRAVVVDTARRAPGPLAVAAVAMTAFQGGYFTGIRLSGVAVGTLVAIGSAPVWAGLLEALAGRRPGLRWLVATAVTVSGTALLVLGGGPDAASGVDLFGVGASLTAGAAYATYAVASKRLVERGVDGTSGMALAFAASGLLLAPALLPQSIGWAVTPRGLVMIVWLSIFTIAAAYTLFAAGLRTVDAPTATTLTLAEPLTATALAVLVVGERLSAAAVVGAVLVTVGLGLAGRRRANERQSTAGSSPEPPPDGTADEATTRGRIAPER
ncbi:DMT family transporter [Egicoccus sp. AB-alg2]|uniref:DMT family transporter n=1 Tax=Egicoccus sp. AB-alg2 TaxID=3242693 RepID=UPI00359D1B7E